MGHVVPMFFFHCCSYMLHVTSTTTTTTNTNTITTTTTTCYYYYMLHVTCYMLLQLHVTCLYLYWVLLWRHTNIHYVKIKSHRTFIRQQLVSLRNQLSSGGSSSGQVRF